MPQRPEPLHTVTQSAAVGELCRALAAGRRVVATGVSGSSTAIVAASVAERLGRPVVLLVAHIDDADEIEAELEGLDRPVLRLPALEVLPGETDVSIELFAERLAAVRRVMGLVDDDAPVIVAPIQAVMQAVPAPATLPRLVRSLRKGEAGSPTELARWLTDAGYTRREAIEEPGEFAVRGGIVDVFVPGGTPPVRLDFFGDELDRITEIDLNTMGSDRAIERADLIAATASAARSGDACSFLDLVPDRAVAIIAETMEVVEQGRGYFERASDGRGIFGPPAVLKTLQQRFHALAEVNQFSAGAAAADVRIDLPTAALPQLAREVGDGIRELVELSRTARVLITCQNDGERARINELVTLHAGEDAHRLDRDTRYIHRGFVWGDLGGAVDEAAALLRDAPSQSPLVVVPSHELLHRYGVKRKTGKLKTGRAMDTFLDFAPGDYVVHQDHGIARFVALEVIRPKKLRSAESGPRDGRVKEELGEPEEFLTLEFAGNARLHVPATQIDLVQKYVGGFHGKPPLSTVGGVKWKHQKEKVAESVRDLAGEMLRVRAARTHMPGIRYPADTAWQNEFEAEFPYDETEDQLAALAEIKKDMIGERPMDRLLCGDVGFGKTELAIRAAFKACEFGKQVAVLVPTTVLAEQHERTFRDRFAAYPFRVESLSRFKTPKEINDTLAALRRGQIDVIIGTHRLISKDVRFADLGLVIIDEEQRFGVEHKERLLQLRMTVDVLTLSATPIPRTLHMAMLGLRDISSLTTAPVDRRAIVTEVIPYNRERVKRAIERELSRDGQVYYVHNRVHDIHAVGDAVRALAPGARVVVGHGQMGPHELEDVMLRFMRRDADILVATTIIESGIDQPSANTMIIDDADRFGLAELHQLRGRVGRSKHRAYCYLLLPADRTVKEVAQKRLKAIEQYSMLGAGFKIAMRDLEIRGAGNLLGAEQSGHIAAVGYEMYCRLLEHAVKELGRHPDEVVQEVARVQVDLGVKGLIPRPYIPSDPRRLEAYRRIAVADTVAVLERVLDDLRAAYGEPPPQVMRLLDLARLRLTLAELGVRAATVRGPDIVFQTQRPELLTQRLEAARAGAPRPAGRPAAHQAGRSPTQPVTQSANQSATWTPRVVAPELAQTNARSSTGEKLAEVWLRPNPGLIDEPESLLRVLLKRLDAPTPAPANAAAVADAATPPVTAPVRKPALARRSTG